MSHWETGKAVFAGSCKSGDLPVIWYRDINWLWRAANAEAGYAAGEVSDHEELVVPEKVFSLCVPLPLAEDFLF